jgi:hypothetical protein
VYQKEAEVASTGNPLIPKDALKKLRGSDGTEGRNIEIARPCKAGDDSEGDDEVDAGENVADGKKRVYLLGIEMAAVIQLTAPRVLSCLHQMGNCWARRW